MVVAVPILNIHVHRLQQSMDSFNLPFLIECNVFKLSLSINNVNILSYMVEMSLKDLEIYYSMKLIEWAIKNLIQQINITPSGPEWLMDS